MINWVPRKTVNYEMVQSLLSLSYKANQYTNGGPVVSMLEKEIHKLLKIDTNKSVICVSNGTMALWAAIGGIELHHSRNLQFCTQSFTFPASAQGYLDNVIIIDNDEGGIDLSKIPEKDGVPLCDGIIVTNVFGNLVNIDKYEKWSRDYNKFLIFDNAATSFSFYNGKNSCNYGNASIVSFHHTKPIGFGEGGCIIIDSLYERSVRNIINFGIDNSSANGKWNRKGGNYKMSDIQAVYILQYLSNFEDIVSKSYILYDHFVKGIKDIPDIELFPNYSDRTPFLSCLSILSSRSNEIIKKLTDNNVYCRKYYNPLSDTPVATEIFNKIVCISFTVDMTISDIDLIIQALI
jgi:dTDP-4-amino-4,6-dideoxygalactose transaminase